MLILMASMDFVLPSGSWYATHPMTSAAIVTILSFVTAGLLLDGWVKEREAARLRPIATIAYRSLAQVANDAGRSLLATLNGADLWLLGVPGHSPDSVVQARARITQANAVPAFAETSGTWSRMDVREWDNLLGDLLRDEAFVRELFRVVAVQRRNVQQATATWAPVMLTAGPLAADLGRFRTLADAFELLQEAIRGCDAIAGAGPFKPTLEWRGGVHARFWEAVDAYEVLRDEFAALAELPSDTITSRRRDVVSTRDVKVSNAT